MKRTLFLIALLVGISFDILLWKKIPGISFFVFAAFCLASGYFLLRQDKINPAKANFFLIVSIVFFAVMTAVHKEPLTSFLNTILTLGLMMLLAMTYRSGQWISYRLREYLTNFFRFLGVLVMNPMVFSSHADTEKRNGEDSSWFEVIKPVLRGVLLALPVLLIFTVLFSSADMVFAERVKILSEYIKFEFLPEYLFRAFLILSISYLFLGAIVYAARQSQEPPQQGDKGKRLQPFLGFTETIIILAGVLILFSLFILIQIEYFFFGQVNITSQGFTYSEYARQGFGELVVVAVFSIMLIECLSLTSKRITVKQNRTFAFLATGLVALVLVVLLSAFQRLALYESAYGFSRSRTYAHFFIIWLAIMLIGIAFIEIIRRKQAFINISLAIALGFSLTLNMMDVDKFIVRNNISRAQQGSELDVAYLSTLSADAVPPLLKSYSSGRLSPEVQDGIGAALVCLREIRLTSAISSKPWQSFHYSDWIAEQNLQKILPDLMLYRIEKKDWEIQVISPDGNRYPCQSDFLFD